MGIPAILIAVDISANLKSRVSKLQAQKTLTTLAEREEIVGKAYGKTIIYCYPQVCPLLSLGS